MTGAFMRVQREGKWGNVEVEFLTDEERDELFTGRDPAELIRWINMLCNSIKPIAEQFDAEERDAEANEKTT